MRATLAWTLLILALVAFSGCSTVEPEIPNATVLYQHTLKVKINDQTIKGFGVAPRAQAYRVKVYPEGKIDRIMIRTCHRELTFDKPDRTFWDILKQDNTFTTDVYRNQEIEDVAACAMEIDVFEERKKRSGFAVVDFLDARPEVSLPVLVKCNGEAIRYDNGVSVCQSAAGLTQEFVFGEPVIVDSGDCPGVFSTEIKKQWLFQMPSGKCTFYFASERQHANGKRIKARVNTLGYSQVPPVN